jgi:hypothetical protein
MKIKMLIRFPSAQFITTKVVFWSPEINTHTDKTITVINRLDTTDNYHCQICEIKYQARVSILILIKCIYDFTS